MKYLKLVFTSLLEATLSKKFFALLVAIFFLNEGRLDSADFVWVLGFYMGANVAEKIGLHRSRNIE
jgi:hypothetical protein